MRMKKQSSVKMIGNIPIPRSKLSLSGPKLEEYEAENRNWMWNFIKSPKWSFGRKSNHKDIDIIMHKEEQSFHSALGPILVMAQCFGLLPVRGIRNNSPHQLQFRFLSARVAYSFIFLLLFCLATTFSVKYFFGNVGKDGTKVLRNLRTTIWGGVFYGNALLATALFMKLASNWPNMMKKWNETEEALREWTFPRLKKRFNLITAIIMVTALCDQILHVAVSLSDYFSPDENYKFPCLKDPNFRITNTATNIKELFQVHSCRTHWFIFDIVNYDECTAGVLFVISKLAIFIWNFTDLFIILISIGLAERFSQFNERITNNVNEKTEEKEWESIREHYNILSRLVRSVDKEIAGIVLLSFANNLCCLGLQLTKTLSDEASPWERVYFSLSFAVLTARTVWVTISAARLHEESKDSLPFLYCCHSNTYCKELERLQTQMTTEEIALTGFRIFSITRSFILVVAGCIFTYVVVLLQFYVAIQDMKNMMEEKMNATMAEMEM